MSIRICGLDLLRAHVIVFCNYLSIISVLLGVCSSLSHRTLDAGNTWINTLFPICHGHPHHFTIFNFRAPTCIFQPASFRTFPPGLKSVPSIHCLCHFLANICAVDLNVFRKHKSGWNVFWIWAGGSTHFPAANWAHSSNISNAMNHRVFGCMVRTRPQESEQLAATLVPFLLEDLSTSWKVWMQWRLTSPLRLGTKFQQYKRFYHGWSPKCCRTWSPKCITNIVQNRHWSPHFPLVISPCFLPCTFLVDIYFPFQRHAHKNENTSVHWGGNTRNQGEVTNLMDLSPTHRTPGTIHPASAWPFRFKTCVCGLRPCLSETKPQRNITTRKSDIDGDIMGYWLCTYLYVYCFWTLKIRYPQIRVLSTILPKWSFWGWAPFPKGRHMLFKTPPSPFQVPAVMSAAVPRGPYQAAPTAPSATTGHGMIRTVADDSNWNLSICVLFVFKFSARICAVVFLNIYSIIKIRPYFLCCCQISW